MARQVTAMRYAQAAFEIAKEQNNLEKWQDDLAKLKEFANDKDVYNFLVNPKVSRAKKLEIIKKSLKGLDQQVLNMICMLIDKSKIRAATEIVEEFERLNNEHKGIEEAEVTTAVALDSKESALLSEKLSKRIGKKVILRNKVDPALVSGMVVRIGDKLIDGCLRSKLKSMHKQLSEGKI